jgi:hypothetical protein
VVSMDFFHWHNPIGRTMALGSTQPLTEMTTRKISWGGGGGGKRGRCFWVTKNHLHLPIFYKYGSQNHHEPTGPVLASNGTALPFYSIQKLLLPIRTLLYSWKLDLSIRGEHWPGAFGIKLRRQYDIFT